MVFPGSFVSTRRVALVAILALCATFFVLQRGASDSAHASIGSPIYGTCTGAKQGIIKGDVTAKGHAGNLGITSLTNEIASPIDAATGQVSGKRQHKPIVITLEVGRATPLLLNALVTNENLTKCTFNFYKANRGGAANYFRIELANAHVIGHTLSGQQGSADSNTFSFAYQKITWTYINGGSSTSASDTWSSAVS